MGAAGDIAPPNINETFQLRRIQFVPAQRPDVTPVPTGVDIIVLNGVLPVSVTMQTQAVRFSVQHTKSSKHPTCRKSRTPRPGQVPAVCPEIQKNYSGSKMSP